MQSKNKSPHQPKPHSNENEAKEAHSSLPESPLFAKNAFDFSDPESFIKLDDDGRLLQINLLSGEVQPLNLSSQELETLHSPELRTNRLVPFRASDGRVVFLQKGLSVEDTYKATGLKLFPYSPFLADEICLRVSSGETLTSICRTPGFPSYGVLCRWRRENPDFEKALDRARRDKGEFYLERAIEEVEKDHLKDDVPLAKLRADVYRAASRVYDPDKFSETNKVSGSLGIHVLQAETGVRRPGDEGFQDVSQSLLEIEAEAGAVDLEIESTDE